jgi:hypothetical protein
MYRRTHQTVGLFIRLFRDNHIAGFSGSILTEKPTFLPERSVAFKLQLIPTPVVR